MKRAVKLWNEYQNDSFRFSDCSTRYEILPFLVNNDLDGDAALASVAEFLGLEIGQPEKIEIDERGLRGSRIKTVNAFKLNETKNLPSRWNEEQKSVPVFLALLDIGERDSVLPFVESLEGKIDSDLMWKIIQSGDFSIRDIIDLSGEKNLLIESWQAFHILALYGYQDFKTLLNDLEIDDSVFDDSVFQCGECGTWDYNDSGYTYNYRVIGCDIYGIRECSCGHEVAAECLEEEYVNNPETCVENEVLELIKGRAEKIETFIGGMVDGRGGYINGESVREGHPAAVLKEFLSKNPDGKYFFVREGSGQFQTYFSIYQLNESEE